jgi:hypothetical protein
VLDILNIVVEVIDPKTKGIVDYGDTSELRLITAFYKVTGTELSYASLQGIASTLNMPIVESVNITWDELMEYQNNSDASTEGYVLRFNGDFRVKVKNNAYINAQKLKDTLNSHSVWKLLNNNPNVKDVYDEILSYPEPISSSAKELFENLISKLTTVKSEAKDIYEQTKQLTDKQLHEYFIDNNTIYEDMVWAYRKNVPERVNKIAIHLIEP